MVIRWYLVYFMSSGWTARIRIRVRGLSLLLVADRAIRERRLTTSATATLAHAHATTRTASCKTTAAAPEPPYNATNQDADDPESDARSKPLLNIVCGWGIVVSVILVTIVKPREALDLLRVSLCLNCCGKHQQHAHASVRHSCGRTHSPEREAQVDLTQL